MVTIPPHCSHKVRPLDCTVFGPFKRYYNVAVKSWMLDNPGKAMTIYNIPQMVAVAFARSMTIENITSGFRVTGIYPFDPNVHSQSDFAPSLVTDRPNPDVPISDGVADMPTLMCKTAVDCEAVPTIDQTQAEVDVAEVVSGDDQTCALPIEVASETVPETNQTPFTPAEADSSTAEVGYSLRSSVQLFLPLL